LIRRGGIYYKRGALAPLKPSLLRRGRGFVIKRGLFSKGIKRGFWGLLKHGISGVYHAVSAKYLQNYINEYAFRYNHRKDEKSMFLTVLEKV